MIFPERPSLTPGIARFTGATANVSTAIAGPEWARRSNRWSRLTSSRFRSLSVTPTKQDERRHPHLQRWYAGPRPLSIFADELRDTGWDYIALGHHHVQTDVSQGRVAAYYAGAPMIEWGGGRPEGTVLRIAFSAEDGIRVAPRRLEILSTSTIRSSSPISR